MNIVKTVLIVTFIVSGLVFARTNGNNNIKSNGVKTQSKDSNYWLKDVSDKSDVKLDRKRSHKRRRKIRKPVKGLR